MTISIEDYFNGKCIDITKEQEEKFLQENGTKNTGKLAEKYVENLLKKDGYKFKKNIRIMIDNTYIIPDFYLYELDIILEVKSRSYTCKGTASDKIDNIPRKYSKIIKTELYKNTKIIVVFCAFEIINTNTIEIIEAKTEYTIDFINLCKKYNVINWIKVENLIQYLPVKIKPFIKWVGGKSKISKYIISKFPKKYGDYYEPFLGGGYIGLSLSEDKKKYFSDINSTLILCYQKIKEDADSLILELSQGNYVNTKDVFLKIREEFNKNKTFDTLDVARFIYLNKCCFNGLYRVNSNGEFNVPFGDMKNPKICDKKLLKNVSKFLQNVDIKCINYNNISPKPYDLVYFDPPYHNTYSGYSKHGFNEDDHIKLKKFIDHLTSLKVYVILSNSNTEFINILYSAYNMSMVNTNYSVGKKRDKIDEVLVTNF